MYGDAELAGRQAGTRREVEGSARAGAGVARAPYPHPQSRPGPIQTDGQRELHPQGGFPGRVPSTTSRQQGTSSSYLGNYC